MLYPPLLFNIVSSACCSYPSKSSVRILRACILKEGDIIPKGSKNNTTLLFTYKAQIDMHIICKQVYTISSVVLKFHKRDKYLGKSV